MRSELVSISCSGQSGRQGDRAIHELPEANKAVNLRRSLERTRSGGREPEWFRYCSTDINAYVSVFRISDMSDIVDVLAQ